MVGGGSRGRAEVQGGGSCMGEGRAGGRYVPGVSSLYVLQIVCNALLTDRIYFTSSVLYHIGVHVCIFAIYLF